MTIKVQGFSEFNPLNRYDEGLRYKTEVFEISNGTSVSEIYDYFNDDPTIYLNRIIAEPDTWGFSELDEQVGYTKIDSTWEEVALPVYPVILLWNFVKVERSDGSGTTPLVTVTTPTDNVKYYEAD